MLDVTQIWPGTVGFLIGIVTGFFIGNAYGSSQGDKNKFFQGAVSTVIFFVWTYSLLKDITDGMGNTPVFLHVFMGVVLGTLNHETGKMLLNILRRK